MGLAQLEEAHSRGPGGVRVLCLLLKSGWVWEPEHSGAGKGGHGRSLWLCSGGGTVYAMRRWWEGWQDRKGRLFFYSQNCT